MHTVESPWPCTCFYGVLDTCYYVALEATMLRPGKLSDNKVTFLSKSLLQVVDLFGGSGRSHVAVHLQEEVSPACGSEGE